MDLNLKRDFNCKMELKLLQQRVNLNEVVTGKDLDYSTYNSKFLMWDWVLHNGILVDGKHLTPSRIKLQKQAIYLLNDDTLYSYHFLRDLEGQPFKYTAYQDLIANCHHDFSHNCPNRYLLFCAANQIGKSCVLINKAIKIANTELNRNVIMISRSLPQSQFLLGQLKQTLDNSHFTNWKEDLITENTTMLTFQTEDKDSQGKVLRTYITRIICAPAGKGSLGYPVHYMFLDELDFYEDLNFFDGVAKPRTNRTKGQIIVFSNPDYEKSKINSVLYRIWKGDLFQRKFHFAFLDAPWNTQEEYDKDNKNTPSYIFASTHDGNWSDSGGAFLKEAEINDMLQLDWFISSLPSVDRPIYIALDLGKMKDQTVLGVGFTRKSKDSDERYADLDIVYTQEFPLGTEYDKVLDRIIYVRDYYKEHYYGVNGIGFDSTGQKTFGDFLKKSGVHAIGVDFSRKESNKTLLYNDFKLMAERRKIRVAFSVKCKKQLAGLEFKETELRKLKKVENKTQTIHDDYCFVAGTKILTDKGNLNIETLKIGDKVLTRKGYKKIIATSSKESNVITKLGLTGTPHHPFITTKGIEKFINLNTSHVLYIWNEKQSCIEKRSIIDILTPKEDTYETTIGHIQNGNNLLIHYIEIFGKMLMVPFQKVKSSITKMVIRSTILWTILNVCLLAFMSPYINKQKKTNRKRDIISLNLQDQKLLLGILLHKAKLGIKNFIKEVLVNLKNINTFVTSVDPNLNQHAKSKQDSAPENVVGLGEIETVYNLKIEHIPEYFANNILVHNCDMISVMIHIAVTPSRVPVTANYIESINPDDDTKVDSEQQTKDYIARTIKSNMSGGNTEHEFWREEQQW